MQLAIIGRDGVINEAPDYGNSSHAEWRPIRGSLEAIGRLHRAGWRVIVASNHPELADGSLNPDTLTRQYEVMRRKAAESGGVIDAVFYCPHAPDAGCDCRLPAVGLLHEIAGRLRTSLRSVPIIGDSLAYVQAAQATDAQPILVKTGGGSDVLSRSEPGPDVLVFNDLYTAVDFLLRPQVKIRNHDRRR